MSLKAQFADEYDLDTTRAAKQACLIVAVRLGSLLDDLVVVGGLVPSLLLPQHNRSDPHIGTADLDLGMSLALLDSKQYAEIADRLRSEGWGPGCQR